jgi:UDP-GlcNAc:undecaprenyl-phosphate GlcNAc-1-phosphate transferase
MTDVLVRFLAAFVLSLAFTPLCRVIAFRTGRVAKPRGDRWHRKATPMLGGVAIFMAVLLAALVFAPLQKIWILLGCGSLIFLVGLVDDIVPLKPSSKLIAEIGLASLLVFLGFRLEWSHSLTGDAMLTLVWIVGITNAFNLLDNMDGLCAGVAVITGTALLAGLPLLHPLTPEAGYLALVLGGVSGFLVYNFHPASIFMGDSGSLFIGLTLASLTLMAPRGSGGTSGVLSTIAAPLLVLLIPIFDTMLVTVSRLGYGRRVSQGGRDHTSHRLVAIGLSERTAVLVLWVLAAFGCLIAVMWRRIGDGWSSVTAALLVLAMAIFAAYLSRIRVYEDAKLAPGEERRVTPFLIEFMFKRRVAEVLLDVCLISISYYASFRLRFEGDREWPLYFQTFLRSLPLVIGVQTTVFFLVGVYRGIWRYFSLMDAVVGARGVLFGTLAIVYLIVYIYRFENYSRGVFVIYAALLVLLLVTSRASFRLISEFARRRQDGRRLVVYGASDAGALALGELLRSQAVTYKMLGFVDDDLDLKRLRIRGYPVLGGYDSLLSLLKGGAIDVVVVAVPLIDAARLAELEALCEDHGADLLRLHVDLEQMVACS